MKWLDVNFLKMNDGESKVLGHHNLMRTRTKPVRGA